MKTQHKQLVNKTLTLIACTEVYQVGRNNTRDCLPVGTIFSRTGTGFQLPRPASVKLLVKMLRAWPGSGSVSTSM